MMLKLLGREPALWLALLYNIVLFVSAFMVQVSETEQVAINAAGAAIVGLLTAWFVARDGLQAAILGFIKALLALALAYGLHMTIGNQVIVMAFVATVVQMFVRTQATAAVPAEKIAELAPPPPVTA
jgi:hypothetical protein